MFLCEFGCIFKDIFYKAVSGSNKYFLKLYLHHFFYNMFFETCVSFTVIDTKYFDLEFYRKFYLPPTYNAEKYFFIHICSFRNSCFLSVAFKIAVFVFF